MDGAPAAGIDLSVVIVSWNTKDLLRDCLASVEADFARSPELRGDVWVVDNASPDGSGAMVAAEFPRVRLIQNTDNAGFARANNQAIEKSEGRWVVLLNSDTLVREGAFAALLAAGEAHPSVGVVGPLLLNGDGTIQRSWSRFVGPLREFLGRHDRS